MALGGLQQAAMGQAPVQGGGLSAAAIRNQLLAQAAEAASAGGALRSTFPVSTIDPALIAGAADDAAAMTAALGGGHSVPKYTSPRLGPALPFRGASVINATGAVDDVVAQASRAGGLRSIAPLVADDFAIAAGATAAGRGGLMGRLAGAGGKAGLLKSVGLPLAGQVGGGMIQDLNLGGEGSDLDRTLGTAVKGAGIGAGIGSVVPLVGTGIGAGVGAAAGGLYGYFTGDKTNKAERLTSSYQGMKETINELGTMYGLSPETMTNVLLEFDAAAQINLQQEDEDGMKNLIATLETTLPQTMLQYRLQEEAERKTNDRMMTMQKDFAPIFQSILGRSAANADVAYAQALKAGDTLAQTNPQLGALISSNAASSRSNQDSLMAAYAAQISTVPSMQNMQEQAILQQTMMG